MSWRNGLGLVVVASVLAAAWFLLGTGEDASDVRTGGRPDPSEASAPLPGTRESEAVTEASAASSMDQTPIASERFSGEAEGIPSEPWIIAFVGPEGVSLEGIQVEIRAASRAGGAFLVGGGREEDDPPWKALRTDSRGEARVHLLPPVSVSITGETSGYCGVATAESERIGPGVRIEVSLKPVRPVRVEVVDAAGRPVEGARVRRDGHGPAGGAQAWTDSEGNARFVVKAVDSSAYDMEKFVAQVTLPAKTYRTEAVAWAEEGETVARVEVERGVLLRVKVFDESGEPASGRFTLGWRLKREELPANEEVSTFFLVEAFSGRSDNESREFDGPETVVTGFASGSTYTLELEERRRCTEEQEVHFEPGPTLRDVVFTRGPAAPVVLIPLVDDRMSPLVEGNFQLEVTYPDDPKPSHAVVMWAGSPSGAVKPDQDGVIRVDVEARRRVNLVLRHRGVGSFFWGVREQKPLLEVEQSPLAPGDVRRLDPVIIPDRDVLVAGRVVDAGGRPVGGAVVRAAPGRRPGHVQAGEMELAQTQVRTAGDGSFSIRKPTAELADDREYRLLARLGEGSASDLVPFEPGQRDVSVPLVPTGGLEGRLIAPPELGKPRVQMTRTGFTVQESLRWVLKDLDVSRQAEEDGSFKFEHASAGRYDVIVSLGGHRVLKVEGVEVVSNRVVRDPRLDGIEVGGHLCRAVVVVQTPDGAPVPRARVSWSPLEGGNARGGGRGHTSAQTGSDGKATTILPDTEPRLLRVAAAGFLPFEATNPIYPFEAVLDAGCALTVVVATRGSLPIEGRVTGWRVSLVDPGAQAPGEGASIGGFLDVSMSLSESFVYSSLENMGGTRNTSAVLDKRTGRGTIKAVAPGSYDIHLSPLSKRQGLKVAGGVLEMPTPAAAAGEGGKPAPLVIGRVTVRPGDREKTLHFSVAPEAIAPLMQ